MHLNRAGNVDRGNRVSTMGAELNCRDVVPTRRSTSRRVKIGFKRNVFGGGHPQRLDLKGEDQQERKNGDGLAHGSGDVRDLNRVEERWEVGTSQMGPEGNHIAGVFDQEEDCSGVSGTVEDCIDSSER